MKMIALLLVLGVFITWFLSRPQTWTVECRGDANFYRFDVMNDPPPFAPWSFSDGTTVWSINGESSSRANGRFLNGVNAIRKGFWDLVRSTSSKVRG